MATVISEGTYEQKKIFTFFTQDMVKKTDVCSVSVSDHGPCGNNFKLSEDVVFCQCPNCLVGVQQLSAN